MALRVLHLVGSVESDFLAELSRLYASDCLEATEDVHRYDVHIAYLTPDLKWRFPSDVSDVAIEAAAPMELDVAIRHLTALNLDVVVPQLFCLAGMTSYRALFDVLGIAYVGNTASAMALGADKAKARAVVAAAGVPVPTAELLRRGDRPGLALPVVVKPVRSDNSLGVSLVRSAAELDDALAAAFTHCDEVLVETYIALGREVRCGIVVRDGELITLPLEEYDVDPVDKPIRRYADKISQGVDGALELVAKDGVAAWILDVGDPITARVWALAEVAHRALGCRDYSLFDFRIDPTGQPWFLEAGLYCSFARQSVIAVMAEAAGLPVAKLFGIAVAEALSR
jgi:D-alanine-D-alanine ligase